MPFLSFLSYRFSFKLRFPWLPSSQLMCFSSCCSTWFGRKQQIFLWFVIRLHTDLVSCSFPCKPQLSFPVFRFRSTGFHYPICSIYLSWVSCQMWVRNSSWEPLLIERIWTHLPLIRCNLYEFQNLIITKLSLVLFLFVPWEKAPVQKALCSLWCLAQFSRNYELWLIFMRMKRPTSSATSNESRRN